jgi:hypothetical protein
MTMNRSNLFSRLDDGVGMVSPAGATSAKASSASAAGASRSVATGSSGGAKRANEEASGGASSFAALLAEREGARGGVGQAQPGAGAAVLGGGEGDLGTLLGAGSGGLGLGRAGLALAQARTSARGAAAGAADGALDGSAEARADGLDADEDPNGPEALGSGSGHGAHGDRGAGVVADDSLSSWARHCQQMTGPTAMAAGEGREKASAVDAAEAPERTARSSLQELMPQLVKKVAWSGDGTRGAVRLELGSGALAGGTLLVQANGSRVSVQLDAPAGTDTASWQRDIRSRLEARGLEVDDVEVS